MKLRDTSSSPAQFGQSSPADKARLASAARQFEAMLMKQVVKALQAPLRKGASGATRGMYDTLADDALAEHLTRGNGTGIAKTLYRQWTGETLQGEAIRRPAATNIGAMSQMMSSANTEVGFQPNTGLVDDGVTPLSQMLPPDGLENSSMRAVLAEPPSPPQMPAESYDAVPLGWDDGRPLRELLPPDGTEKKLSLNSIQSSHDDPTGGVFVSHGDNENGYQKRRRLENASSRNITQPESASSDRQRVIRAYQQGGG